MNAKPIVAAIGLSAAAIGVGQLSAAPGDPRSTDAPAPTAAAAPVGEQRFDVEPQGGIPDVIVFKISGYVNYSQAPYRAYAVGTTSCNIGDVPLVWQGNNNQHPVIGQNMFRLAAGPNGHARFEHIGQSWLKHGFCALDLSECGQCQGTGCSSLGVGCSDPYSASLNGSQSGAGPKWQVNSTNGFFPYPPANPSYSGQVARRLRVAQADVDQQVHDDAEFFVEAQYVCPDENPEIDVVNARNNVSWRQISMNFAGAINGYVGDTQIGEAAVFAWKAADPEVEITTVTVPGEGTIYVASRVYDNGDGTWDYEYAVQNQDVHRSVGSFTVPVSSGAAVSGEGFSDVDYHSGEPFDDTDWESGRLGDELTWATVDHADDPNGNAIRWGTLYNFRFTADASPVDGEVVLGMFMPGTPEAVAAAAPVPAEIAAPCPADLDGSGEVDFDDLVTMLSAWGDCAGCPEDLDGSGSVGFDDLLELLGLYGPCP